MIQYNSPDELARSLSLRLRIFNTKTGEEVPDIYDFPMPDKKTGLLRLRRDLDDIVDEYNVLGDQCSFRFYVTTRERIEALSDIIDHNESDFDKETQNR